jgi:ATP-dependent Clp protease ATP-binding subunit ClpC
MIIMTSNIGVRQLKDFGAGVGFSTSAKAQSAEDTSKGVIEKALKRTFSPEFLNRIDDVIIFNQLDEGHIALIIDIIMKDVLKRLDALGFKLDLKDAAKKFIAEKGYDQQFGARPLHRAIQKYLEDPLAEELLNQKIKEGDTVVADYNEKEGKITFKIEKPSTKKSESTEAE